MAWTDVTANLMAAAGAPPFPYYVSWVETSHFEGERAYVSLDGHWDDDYAPYIFVTEDLGATWRSLTRGLASATVNVVREYHANPNVLIVGAEDGAFASIDRGATWGHLGSGIPAVPVDDIEIHPRDNDVVAGTHGRGIYVLDDIGLITPYLHIESDGVAGTMTAVDEPIFTPPRPATMFLYRNDVPSQGQGMFRAANPAYGAWFDYWLPDAVDEGARFAIHDASGAVVRTLDGPGAPGLNRVTWDLRHDPISHDTTRYAVPNLDSGPDGPFVLPGEFTVALTVGDERRQQDLTVRPDERLRVSEADRIARYEFTLELHELKRLAYEEGVAAYDLEREASEAVEALEGADDVDEDVLERAKELAAEIQEVADEWRDINNNIRNWWTGLLGNFDGGPSTTGSLTGPSDDQRRRLGRLTDEARVAGERLDEVEGDVIAELRGLSP